MSLRKHRSDHFLGNPNEIHTYVVRLYADEWSNGEIGIVDFKIHQIAGLTAEKDGQALYLTNDSHMTENLDEAEAIVGGTVKWDGCTQFHADVHVDHRSDLEGLCKAILEARKLAAKTMTGMLINDIHGEYSEDVVD